MTLSRNRTKKMNKKSGARIRALYGTSFGFKNQFFKTFFYHKKALIENKKVEKKFYILKIKNVLSFIIFFLVKIISKKKNLNIPKKNKINFFFFSKF